jgi:drug/metabolite transporter (DMT)-like permease
LPLDSRKLGIVLVLLSAVLWSTAGLFVRMADMDVWSVIAWRSAFTAIVIGLYLAVRKRVERRETTRTFGWPGVISTVVAVVGATTYITALTWTSVANVMTVYAALPFLSTAVAFLWLGERVSLRFLIAGAVACGGIALTVGAAFAPRDLLGIGIAFLIPRSTPRSCSFSRPSPAP